MRILYLAHRIPFPPTKGDKIRSFHEIKHFGVRHEVHLVAFYDDKADLMRADALKSYCRTVKLIPLHPRLQQARALWFMMNGHPWTLGYFNSPTLRAAVREKLSDTCFDAVFVFSSAMAPYVTPLHGIRKIIDFVDSDASKWLQYSRFKPIPMRWLYSYEGIKLSRFEHAMVQAFDAAVFVSAREARRLAGCNGMTKIHFVQNGIDVDYFNVPRTAEQANNVIFTGAMNYFPNVDAVCHFTRDVLPLVRAACPDVQFFIVGSQPTAEVRRLAALPGVQVTGAVPDIRPFLARSQVAVVPMRISQGIQNKILEALAAGLPVVTTPAASEGFKSTTGMPLAVAHDAKTYAEEVIQFLRNPLPASQVAHCRNQLKRHYNWDTNLAVLDRLLEESAGVFSGKPEGARQNTSPSAAALKE